MQSVRGLGARIASAAMGVVVQLPETDLKPRFVLAPIVEAALSIHVLCGPRQHALHAPWVRACRDLSSELRREIRVFRFFFERGIGGLFPTTDDEPDFYDGLRRVTAASDEDVVDAFVGFLLPPDTDMNDPGVERDAVAAAEETYPHSVELVRLVFTDPAEARTRITALMTRYWEEAFAAEWRRIEPSLRASASLAAERFENGEERAFLTSFNEQFRFDPERRQLVFRRPYEAFLSATDAPLALTPSLYTWPHVMLSVQPTEPVALVYPAATSEDPRPPAEVTRAVQLLADETRLAILRLLTRQPRSTQELSTLLYLSEAAVSRHLTQLAAAGIVDGRRDGYYVVYEVRDGAVEATLQGLRRALAPPD